MIRSPLSQNWFWKAGIKTGNNNEYLRRQDGGQTDYLHRQDGGCQSAPLILPAYSSVTAENRLFADFPLRKYGQQI